MATETAVAVDVPVPATESEKQVAVATSGLDGLTVTEPPAKDEASAINTTTEQEIDALSLPHSSADGVTSKPTATPLDSCKPKAVLPLTVEKQDKYNRLLAAVSKWTDVPESSAKGAKDLPLEDFERMFMTRECLLRNLRADKWDVAKAEARLRSTLTWRREYGIDKFTPDYISTENATGKQVLFGFDNEARPCHYMQPSRQNTEKTDRQLHHLFYMIERNIDLMPPGQEKVALIINFADMKMGQGASIAQGIQTVNILQHHYPERLGRAIVINLPWYINAFFKAVTPFIDTDTKQKIAFNEDSAKYVPPEQLLKETGGKVEFEYDHDVYWPTLNKLCEIKRQQRRERWELAGKKIGESEIYLRGGDAKPVDAEAAQENVQHTAQD